MAGKLAGRVAVVTGASRGIGRAVALRYAREGAHVIAVARHGAALDSLADDILASGGPAASCADIDLTDALAVDDLAEWVAEQYGHVDVLVGNAAIVGEAVSPVEQDPSDFTEVLKVNTAANQTLIRAFDALLRAAPAGRAIFATSGLVYRPMAHLSAYCASKAALEVLVRCYAEELAGTEVGVNLLDPGVTDTQLFRTAMPGADTSGMKSPDLVTDAFVTLALPSETRSGALLSWKAV